MADRTNQLKSILMNVLAKMVGLEEKPQCFATREPQNVALDGLTPILSITGRLDEIIDKLEVFWKIEKVVRVETESEDSMY